MQDRKVRDAARARLDGKLDGAADEVPPFWSEVAGLGWLGLHVPEEHGGQGFGLAELAVVVEELGHAVAPGPFLPTVVAAATILEAGTPAQRGALLPGLVDGSHVAAVAVGPGARTRRRPRGPLPAAPAVPRPVPRPVPSRRRPRGLRPRHAERHGMPVPRPDPPVRHRRAPRGTQPREVLAGGVAVARARRCRTLAAAEAAGGVRACLEMAVEYALAREQFGRVIGSFQAIKHHCAELLVDAELADAAAWDAVRDGDRSVAEAELVAAVAACGALPAYRHAAEMNIQIHGGIGYTWEHDAHLFLRRAAALSACVDPARAADDVTRLAGAGVDVQPRLELPPEAESYRAEAREFHARHDALPPGERRGALIDSGYFVPHWPQPWGRGAGAVEQLVVEEELAGVEQPELGIGAWVLLTLVQRARPDQVARWVRPSLEGEMRWCQLFSEPNAGSDAAAISTRAQRVDGGWLVNGQKVWTSGAMTSTMGLATVRTDPDAPKHAGVTTMAIDMRADGVTVRPLREITGETLFNEVFFDDVFVADDDVVGEVNDGWSVARATLGNERRVDRPQPRRARPPVRARPAPPRRHVRT